jgi:hypothetical protein
MFMCVRCVSLIQSFVKAETSQLQGGFINISQHKTLQVGLSAKPQGTQLIHPKGKKMMEKMMVMMFV